MLSWHTTNFHSWKRLWNHVCIASFQSIHSLLPFFIDSVCIALSTLFLSWCEYTPTLFQPFTQHKITTSNSQERPNIYVNEYLISSCTPSFLHVCVHKYTTVDTSLICILRHSKFIIFFHSFVPLWLYNLYTPIHSLFYSIEEYPTC